jgi:hypothetical protein
LLSEGSFIPYVVKNAIVVEKSTFMCYNTSDTYSDCSLPDIFEENSTLECINTTIPYCGFEVNSGRNSSFIYHLPEGVSLYF